MATSVSLNLDRVRLAGNVILTGVSTTTSISAVALGFSVQVTSNVYVPAFKATPSATSRPSASASVLGAMVYVNSNVSMTGNTCICPLNCSMNDSPTFTVMLSGASISLTVTVTLVCICGFSSDWMVMLYTPGRVATPSTIASLSPASTTKLNALLVAFSG